MTRDTRVVLTGGAALALALTAGTLLEWADWVNVVLAVVLIVGTGVLATRGPARRESRPVPPPRQQPEPEPVPAPQPPPPASREVTSVRLPSSEGDIPFTLSCTVQWYQQAHGHPDPGVLAVQAVLHRAHQAARSHHPEDTGAVHAIAATLSHPATDSTNTVRAWAAEVRVYVNDEHRAYLRDMAALRRQQHLAKLEIANERFVREYLNDEVLTSAGSTVVWWLARDKSKVKETVDLIGSLARLSAAARDTEVDEAFRALVPEHLRPAAHADHETPGDKGFSGPGLSVVDSSAVVTGPGGVLDLLPDPADERHALFGRDLVDLLVRHDHPDLAARARDHYGVDDWSSADPTPGDADQHQAS
ncbi:hypothetical protein [Actinokineospora cianjurensis]|uniref:Uncharacterized protein n=1 Tax=Actinokineospora cianjurensis TaxID=585224 RepID=A0A421B8Z0_9PSEU|nr:hypothetical protein [Actinokineospora cianjurensis]RLK60715.1 hypothetical protein CLV68_1224 [Actinokineospora cianjurensis]